MPLKNILLHVDDSKHCEARFNVAAQLAAAHEAKLSAVYVLAPPYIPTYMAAQLSAEVIEAQAKFAREAAERAEEDFNKWSKAAGISAEWRVSEGLADDVVVTHGRYSDLVVMGQADPAESEQFYGGGDVVAQIILDAGRPVLVVPYAGHFETVGTNVLVAWNASREAARAVNDALPILEKADKVTVMNVNPDKGLARDGDVPGADISLHLARHGVKAEASTSYAEDIEIGDTLLSRAADLGADLIVMGGYGRSRFRELVMGGASRHLLLHMTVPVLMSH